jgi:hypothetical protein
MLYRVKGNQDKMVQEYLSYVTQSAANIQYVKNVLQTLLTKQEELESLEKHLYDKVQQYPDVEVYAIANLGNITAKKLLCIFHPGQGV